ncbi:hypothetical protein RNJ44_02740 [Nakaseomyces bracarensis]|uniref:PCI domain-containing protein n=1 Tax=Nakaseomyces bracarensis TaxID=273131 RepID=A0ABR4P023_9SACH
MSYNQVKPITLGQNKKKINKNSKNDSNLNQSNTSHLSMPINPIPQPDEIFPKKEESILVNPAIKSFPQFPAVNNIISSPGLVQNRKRLKSNKGVTVNKLNSNSDNNEAERRRKRAERFSNNTVKKNELEHVDNLADLNSISTKSHIFDKDQRIVGRCTKLEKSYLRLTSEPNPDLIRPHDVLEKAFNLLMEKYKKKEVNYTYLCDQFKAIRQDLRVQMIEDSFTMTVYQEHARIALENSDLGEFNQCQSRLMVLYENTTIKRTHREEFTLYLILYYILMQDYSTIEALKLKLILERGKSIKNAGITLAFEIAEARLVGNYHKFMKLCANLKGLGRKLVDAFIDQEILKILVTICKSYNQLNLIFLSKELQFESIEDTIQYLKKKNLAQFIVTKNLNLPTEFKYLDTKACRPVIIQIYSKLKKVDIKGQL